MKCVVGHDNLEEKQDERRTAYSSNYFVSGNLHLQSLTEIHMPYLFIVMFEGSIL
jgi:hypothetical protein